MRSPYLTAFGLGALAILRFTSAASLKSDIESRRSIIKRAETAGIGVELEWRGMRLQNEKAGEATQDDLLKIKGAPLQISDLDVSKFDKGKGDWQITAELSGVKGAGAKILLPEFIVFGEKVKVGSERLGTIGAEIEEFLGKWKPSKASDKTISIQKFSQFGHWKVTQPSTWIGASFTDWGMQVTVPLSLESVYNILDKVKDKKPVGPLEFSGTKASRVVLVEERDLKPHGIKPTKDVLGFLSLVTSYAKGAEGSQAAEGPKQIIPVMPRTDFAAIYGLVKHEFDTAFKKDNSDCDEEGGGLYQLVKALAKQNLDKAEFKWDPETASSKGDEAKGVDWPTKAKDVKGGTLPVKTWLEYLQGGNDGKGKSQDLVAYMDSRMRYEQIGKLGNKMEKLYKSNKEAPIFELRDLGSVKGDQISEKFKEIEKEIMKLNSEEAGDSKKERSDIRRRFALPAPAPAPSRSKKQECPKRTNQPATCSSTQINENGKCKACPAGKVPNSSKDKCVDKKAETETKCSSTQIKNSKGKCEKCPKGKKPNATGTKCV